MAEQSAGATCESRRKAEAFYREAFMTNGVDTAMEAMQATRDRSSVDGPL
jgi:hypothetical protein